MSQSKKPPTIVRVQGRFAKLKPAIRSVLRPLTKSIHDLYRRPNGRIQLGRRNKLLYEVTKTPKVDADDWASFASFAAGLVPVVERQLSKHGISSIRLPREGLVEIPEPSFHWASTASQPDREFLGFIRNASGGVIFHSDEVNPAWLVTQAALAYPVPELQWDRAGSDAWKVCQATSATSVPVDAVACRRMGTGDAERLVVSLYKKLICSSVEIAERDIVFMLRADEMLSVVGDRLYPHLGRAHVFGFLPWTTDLTPGKSAPSRTVVRAGTHDYSESRASMPRCRVCVSHFKKAPIKCKAADWLSIRRKGIWANRARNAQIAELAVAIRSRQRADIKAKLPALIPLLPSDREPGVLITVQSKEHANRLLEFLPGWVAMAHSKPPVIQIARLCLGRL